MAIQFICPHCQLSINVDDQYAGATGPCKKCGQSITIPGSPVAPGSPFAGQSVPPQPYAHGHPSGGMAPPARSSSAAWIPLLAVLGLGAVMMIGVLIALLLPAVQKARSAARRAGCINNERYIALAMLNYEAAYRELPPAYNVDDFGTPLLSWRVHILPFIDEDALYEQFHLDEPWDSPHNIQLAELIPAVYQCPASEAAPGNTNYVVVTDPNSAFPGAEGCKYADIADGTSRTALVVEVPGGGVPWTKPADLTINELDRIGSEHDGVVIVAFADGHSETMTQVPRSVFIRNDGQ